MKNFIFGIRFRYIHQVEDHKNNRHPPIFLERKWTSRLFPDQNFAWCFALSEVKTALASGHFQNYGVVQPSLDVWISLEIECLENIICIELGDNGRPKRAF